jgi:hypothetical protein
MMKGAIMQFNSDGNPSRTAVYLVDRDKQGKWYRFYNAETDKWGRCESDLQDAYTSKDNESPVGFFPWVGPLTGPDFKQKAKKMIDAETALVNEPVDNIVSQKPIKPIKPKKPVKPVKSKVSVADGVIMFREDRQKYVTFIGGKQVAARPTVEAIQKYLMKNHGIEGTVQE